MIQRVSYQLLSLLLQYPERWWATDFREEMEELEPKVRDLVNAFLGEMERKGIDEVCAQYVETFDFAESTSLYLTYRELKEDRARGPVLVQLKEMYREFDVQMEEGELPDYLPLILEFMAIVPAEEAIDRLASQFEAPIKALSEELMGKKSPYAYLLEAVIDLLSKRKGKHAMPDAAAVSPL